MSNKTNILLVVALGFFSLLIIFEFLQLNKQKQTAATVQTAPEQVAQNLNKNNFEIMKKQTTASTTSDKNEVESRFWGVISSVLKPSGGLTINLTGKQPPFEGKAVSYTYSSSALPKVSAYVTKNNEEIGMTIGDLKAGDEVYIYEKNDLNKTYPDGIVGVRIVKIN